MYSVHSDAWSGSTSDTCMMIIALQDFSRTSTSLYPGDRRSVTFAWCRRFQVNVSDTGHTSGVASGHRADLVEATETTV